MKAGGECATARSSEHSSSVDMSTGLRASDGRAGHDPTLFKTPARLSVTRSPVPRNRPNALRLATPLASPEIGWRPQLTGEVGGLDLVALQLAR